MGNGVVDSKWWYSVLIIGVLEPLTYMMPVLLQESGLYTQEMVESGTINVFAYVGLLLIVVMLFSIPVLAISLYQDATAVRESSLSWNPDPRLWGAGGAGVPIGGFVLGTPLIWAVALAYLVKRFRAGSSSPIPDLR